MEGDLLFDAKEITWSWSRINSFYLAEQGEGCFLNWQKQYIEGDRGCGNFFSSFGLIVHETVEKIHKQELFPWDVEEEIRNRWNNLEYRAPFKKMSDSYYNSLFNFFDIDEYEKLFANYNIKESEEEFRFEIDGFKFVGFADIIGEHKKYGNVIGDMKSSKPYVESKLDDNIKQLYLYSVPYKEKYGHYPDHLIYIFFREKEKMEYAYKFDLDKLEETKKFVIDAIHRIEDFVNSGQEFKPLCLENQKEKEKGFYPNQLCNHRFTCDYK